VVKRNAVPTFSTEIIKALAESLPEPLSKRRRQLLPQILSEWISTDLPVVPANY
jgi:hypothetical protein